MAGGKTPHFTLCRISQDTMTKIAKSLVGIIVENEQGIVKAVLDVKTPVLHVFTFILTVNVLC
ncbi:hypothetical protein AYR63_05065 [Secundilactobacillus paracollinoides]|uniref:Uncharacterized protein n=1 Tax=Secundilactobacillus paracollinoides TaxID=240427 RepID=A0A1B2IWU9_9LACO|nr:hypothetical protein AYR63_05065 [Secundilactobacillus paracollinoides]